MRLTTAIITFLIYCLAFAGSANGTPVDPAPVRSANNSPANASTADALPNTPLQPYRASYSATYNGLPLTMVRTLEKTTGGYKISAEASNFLGTIAEEESFKTAPGPLIEPEQYQYQRSILGRERSERSLFNRNSNIVTNTYKDTHTQLPYSVALLGPLSYQIQLQIDLTEEKTDLAYAVVSRGKVREYRYRLVREETLDTPLGSLDTLVLEKVRNNQERQTFLWVARKLQFLPVKLLQTEEGESYEMLISSYTLTDQ